jgi:hypothetical protein
MKAKLSKVLLALTSGAVALQFGGCGEGGFGWVAKMVGDAIGDTLAYNVFLD